MIRLTVILFILAVVAALFGSGDVEPNVAQIAKYISLACTMLFLFALFSINLKKR